jgi:NaMN:DMB phosphoribosyltransferase
VVGTIGGTTAAQACLTEIRDGRHHVASDRGVLNRAGKCAKLLVGLARILEEGASPVLGYRQYNEDDSVQHHQP